MAPVKWHEGPMVAYDCESSGTDVFADRIVTAAVVHHTPDERPRTLSWLVDPGVSVPPEAAAVHGWTDARLAQRLDGAEALFSHPGRADVPSTRAQALYEITGQLALAMSQGVPVVIANAPYDLTLLEAENVRHGQPTLAERLAPKGVRGVVDVMVLDKQHDPYRKVKGGCKCGCGAVDKTLAGLCLHYHVLLGGAHDASADALAALRLVGRLVAAWPEVGRWRLPTLFEKQVGWRREQMDSLRAYFDKAGVEHDGCDGTWPVRVAPTTAGVAS